MADRLNYYFRQKVTEAELDLGFANLEEADRALITDGQLYGVWQNAVVSEHAGTPNLTVDVSGPGIVYDKLGQRILWSALQVVDVSVDESAVTTTVAGGGNSKIVSVFAKFKRVLTDPRTDGNSVTVYFSEAESFEFKVRQGAEAVSPTPPALDAEYILLADITRSFGVTTILNAAIGITRREETFVQTVSGMLIRAGTIAGAFSDILTHINDHKVLATAAHNASAIVIAVGTAWADASGISAVNVDTAIEEIVSDLQSSTAGISGAHKIGSATVAQSPTSLAGTTIAAQLAELLTAINARARLASTETITGAWTGPSFSKVWGFIDSDGAGPANAIIRDHVGVASCVIDGTGHFVITFTTARPNANYAWWCDVWQNTSAAVIARVTAKSTTTLTIGLFTIAGALVDQNAQQDGVVFGLFDNG